MPQLADCPSDYEPLLISRVMGSFSLLAGSKMQLQIDRALGWANAADVIAQDADTAAIAFLA